jgi:hypothetical protein
MHDENWRENNFAADIQFWDRLFNLKLAAPMQYGTVDARQVR